MIKEFVQAWNKNNSLLLREFEKEGPNSYAEIVKKLITIVLNPYLEDSEDVGYNMNQGIDIDKMTIIDNEDYQGTAIYIMPYNTCQPEVRDYVMTNNYYGSCSECDTFQAIYYGEDSKLKAAKDYHDLALHLLQKFKPLTESD